MRGCRRAAASSLALLGMGLSACRAIVGITELTVDAGAGDSGNDGLSLSDTNDEFDSSDGGSDVRHDGRSDGESDARADESFDATSEQEDVDALGNGTVDCSDQPPSQASRGRIACLGGCVSGHFTPPRSSMALPR